MIAGELCDGRILPVGDADADVAMENVVNSPVECNSRSERAELFSALETTALVKLFEREAEPRAPRAPAGAVVVVVAAAAAKVESDLFAKESPRVKPGPSALRGAMGRQQPRRHWMRRALLQSCYC